MIIIFPDKQSLNWIFVLIGIFIVNIGGLASLSACIAPAELSYGDMIKAIVLSVVISLIASLGYFGAGLFSKVFIIGNIISIACLVIYVITDYQSEWKYVFGIIIYLFIICLSFIIGIFVQLISNR